MSNMTSANQLANLSPPPTAFIRLWSAHRGPPSQVAFVNQPANVSMQQVFGNMSLADAWMSGSRRGSTPQLLNTGTASGQQAGLIGGNLRGPRPLRAASLPVAVNDGRTPLR